RKCHYPLVVFVYIKAHIAKVRSHHKLGVWELVEPFLVSYEPDKGLILVRVAIHLPELELFYLLLQECVVGRQYAPDNVDCMRTHAHLDLLFRYCRKLLLDFACVSVLCRLVRPYYTIAHRMVGASISFLARA